MANNIKIYHTERKGSHLMEHFNLTGKTDVNINSLYGKQGSCINGVWSNFYDNQCYWLFRYNMINFGPLEPSRNL